MSGQWQLGFAPQAVVCRAPLIVLLSCSHSFPTELFESSHLIKDRPSSRMRGQSPILTAAGVTIGMLLARHTANDRYVLGVSMVRSFHNLITTATWQQPLFLCTFCVSYHVPSGFSSAIEPGQQSSETDMMKAPIYTWAMGGHVQVTVAKAAKGGSRSQACLMAGTTAGLQSFLVASFHSCFATVVSLRLTLAF